MSLTNPRLGYKTITDAIRNLFRSNMSALNTNLAGNTFTVNAQIIKGNPYTIPLSVLQYPCILIKLISKSESFIALGAGGRKRPKVIVRIYGITTQGDSPETAEDEIEYLADNIEAVLRDNIAIDGTSVDWGEPISADFAVGDFGNGTYVNLVAIDFEGKKTIE